MKIKILRNNYEKTLRNFGKIFSKFLNIIIVTLRRILRNFRKLS